MSRETDISNLVYNESQCDINCIKYRKNEFDHELAARINNHLAKAKAHGYKNHLNHDMTDRLLMIQEEKGVNDTIRYFRWRIEGSLTYSQFYDPSQELEKSQEKEALEEIKKQLADMQQLMINMSLGMNDELKERRLKAV